MLFMSPYIPHLYYNLSYKVRASAVSGNMQSAAVCVVPGLFGVISAFSLCWSCVTGSTAEAKADVDPAFVKSRCQVSVLVTKP